MSHARSCRTKQRSLPTYAEALDAAERMMEAGKVHPGCHVTPYECNACHGWHLYNRVIVRIERQEKHA